MLRRVSSIAVITLIAGYGVARAQVLSGNGRAVLPSAAELLSLRAVSGAPRRVSKNPVGTSARCASRQCIYVANLFAKGFDRYGGSAGVYGVDDNGNVKPARILKGRATDFSWPMAIGLDSSHSIYVTNTGYAHPSVTVFGAGADGNAKPMREIVGSNTELGAPTSILVDAAGSVSVGDTRSGAVFTYAAGADGNVAPINTIGGPDTGISNPWGLAMDAQGYLYVGEQYVRGGAVDVFAPGSSGDAVPARVITGSNTDFWCVGGIALDSTGNLYVTNDTAQSVLVFAPGANGNVAPIRVIYGANTQLSWPAGIAIGRDGRLYVSNGDGEYGSESINVYAPNANGNVAPIQIIQGSAARFNHPIGIAVQ